MAITLNDNLQINAGKPIDAKYLNGAVDYVDIARSDHAQLKLILQCVRQADRIYKIRCAIARQPYEPQ